MEEYEKPQVEYVGGEDALALVVTHLAIMTGWMLVWRQYTNGGWKLVVVRLYLEDLV